MTDYLSPEYKNRAPIEIFEATPEDAEGIVQVQHRAWLDTYPNEEYGIKREDIESMDWSAQKVERWFRSIKNNLNTWHTWVAKENGKVVGFCTASKTEMQNVNALYVDPDYQSMGIGKQLLGQAIGWLNQKPEIWLEVAKYNQRAIDFYSSMGFTEARDLGLSVKLPSGKSIPEIYLVRRAK